MKLLLVLGLTLLTHLSVAHAKIKYTVVHTEMKVDLKNIFKGGQKVDYRNFNIPEEIVHTYTVKIKYIIPIGMLGGADSQYLPQSRTCNVTGCTDHPAHYQIQLNISHQDFGIHYELYDDGTNKLVSSSFAPLTIQYVRRQSGPEMQFYGMEAPYWITKTPPALSVYGKALLYIDVGTRRLANTVFAIGRLEQDDTTGRGHYRKNYVVDAVDFKGPDIKRNIGNKVTFEYNRREIGSYFEIGQPNHQYPSSSENFLGIEKL